LFNLVAACSSIGEVKSDLLSAALALSAPLILSACIPMSTIYYEPHGRGRVLHSETDANYCAPLVFDIGTRDRPWLIAYTPDKNSLSSKLVFTLRLYPGETVRFQSRSVRLTTNHGTLSSTLTLEKVEVNRLDRSPRGSQDTLELMSGPPIGESPKKITAYMFELELPLDPPQDFTVLLPTMTVGDHSIEPGPLDFTLTKTVYMKYLM
jgi:hypothetical protein